MLWLPELKEFMYGIAKVVYFISSGKKYFDFLSAYSAVNQGHCHPKIYKTFV